VSEANWGEVAPQKVEEMRKTPNQRTKWGGKFGILEPKNICAPLPLNSESAQTNPEAGCTFIAPG